MSNLVAGDLRAPRQGMVCGRSEIARYPTPYSDSKNSITRTS